VRYLGYPGERLDSTSAFRGTHCGSGGSPENRRGKRITILTSFRSETLCQDLGAHPMVASWNLLAHQWEGKQDGHEVMSELVARFGSPIRAIRGLKCNMARLSPELLSGTAAWHTPGTQGRAPLHRSQIWACEMVPEGGTSTRYRRSIDLPTTRSAPKAIGAPIQAASR
jgi:hypothetical protein